MILVITFVKIGNADFPPFAQFAFGIFGGSQKQKLLLGVVLAVFLKFTGHVLSGVVFFSQNAWDGWGAWAYSLTYHLTSKVPEGIATGAVLLALPVTLFKKVGKAGACA